MIIQCNKCFTKFNLDESLLDDQGSRVRCSVCKHVFVAYPSNEAPSEEAKSATAGEVPLGGMPPPDSETLPQEETGNDSVAGQADDFDRLFEESLENLEEGENVSPKELYDLAGESSDGTGGHANAPQIKEDLFPTEFEEIAENEMRAFDEAASAVSERARPAKSYGLTIVLGVILAITGACAAVVFLAPEWVPASMSFLKPEQEEATTDATGLRRLSFKTVTGAFVESKNAGRLFVIQGMVTNNYPTRRSHILVKGSILDDKGQVVMNKLAYAGNSFKDEEIENTPLGEIQKAMKNRYGMGRSNFNVAPEESVPFTLVFENLPANLSEFTVEAVSSSPGT